MNTWSWQNKCSCSHVRATHAFEYTDSRAGRILKRAAEAAGKRRADGRSPCLVGISATRTKNKQPYEWTAYPGEPCKCDNFTESE